MKVDIKSKLVAYIFCTIIITIISFSIWFLDNEKSHWYDYHLKQNLSFTTYISPEIIKKFGRELKYQELEMVFSKNVRELLQVNKDLIKYMILKDNGAVLYNSESINKSMYNNYKDMIENLVSNIDEVSLRSKMQSYKILTGKGGSKLMDIIVPVAPFRGGHILYVRYIISFSSAEKQFIHIRNDLYISTLLMLSVSLLLLIIIANKITAPVSVLTGVVTKMRTGDFDARVIDPTNDEIGELANAFNEMANVIKSDRESIEQSNVELKNANVELKDLHEQLMQSERLAAVGQLAAGVSHEIDNPIGIILGYAELIRSEIGDESHLADDIDSIIHESKRCRRIVGGLLNFSKPSPTFKEKHDLNDIIKETVSAVSMQALFKKITIYEDYDKSIPVILIDRDKVKQILINLMLNAAQAIYETGEIKVVTKYIKDDSGERVKIIVSDNGVGIAQENIKKIYNPFFTTKSHGKGTGLGLSVCQKLIQEQGGTIKVESVEAEGTTFSIIFPQ